MLVYRKLNGIHSAIPLMLILTQVLIKIYIISKVLYDILISFIYIAFLPNLLYSIIGNQKFQYSLLLMADKILLNDVKA